ncbi:Phosphohistidine phosphatase SixA [Zhongshania aliphaticivorans]|uniref:Phosphohistidine phosphatase SixA n=1 Tax=Zhongshania aliphaticivorans TaxID=1470434 RepID=A0A5S9P0A9_9GAMM|nr:phosphohistidine phosphatase SixA [Zhongshania aliphaticivorans]CAA0089641.1 Phosphohistidine phosphatase SixA [Zhongshania aliphaticivorans]CAA0096544.1 Phosphohistidine phosphatase SixA [Zhongshania aliphaticivorans]
MEILLIRHGTASWDTKTDIERELTERGREEVQAASEWIKSTEWQPDELWVSPYRRAVQTAEILNIDWQLRPRLKSSLTPDTPLSELEPMLATFSGERLLLVSHNPLLSNAIAYWHSGANQSYWGMQPASMALVSAEVIAQGCGNLEWLRHYPNYDHNGK